MRVLKKILSVLAIVLLAVLCVYGLAMLFGRQVLYPEFTRSSEKGAAIPGLSKGFTPQGVSYLEGENCTLICGYYPGSEASRIYMVYADGRVKEIPLRRENGDIYTPSCQKEDGLLPVPHMKVTISFACNPTQRERIVQDVQDLMKGMAEGDLITQDLIDSYLKEREKHAAAFKDNEYSRRRDYLTQEFNGIVVKEGDMTYIRQVTPASLRAHVKKLLKQGTLHVGYLTTE